MKSFFVFLSLILFGCNSIPEKEEKSAANMLLASRYFTEVYNQDRIDLIDTLFTKDYQHTNTEGKVMAGRDAMKSAVERIESLLPNLEVEIEEALADNEKVMLLIRMRSDLPEMAGNSATAEQTDFNELFIFWIRDERIYKGRSVGAHLPFIKQVSGFDGGLLELIGAITSSVDSRE